MNKKKVKVLFAINDLGVGGAQNMVIEETNAMDKEAFDVYILSIYNITTATLEHKSILSADRRIKIPFGGLFDVPAWFLLYHFLKTQKFDAVITNLFNTNLIVRTVAFFAGVPVIMSWEHNIYEDKKSWQVFCDRMLARRTYRILVGAPQVKEFTVKQERLPKEKVEVVYDAAELTFNKIRESRNQVLEKMGLPTDCLYVVACGLLNEQKGHTFFVDAARIVREHYHARGKDIRFIIFGTGVLKDPLTEQIKKNGLDGVCLLPGIAPMTDILAISDIFSLISLWEGFSIALIQAMNAGCAIVASTVSGSVDALETNVSALLVPPADSQAAAHAYIKLIEDESLCERLGSAAQEKSKLYDVKEQIKRIEALIVSGLKSS